MDEKTKTMQVSTVTYNAGIGQVLADIVRHIIDMHFEPSLLECKGGYVRFKWQRGLVNAHHVD